MSSIDVVVPCYRYGRYLAECVHSILVQEDVEARVLIIDDASPDDTPSVSAELCKDPRVTFVQHAQNMGHIATYNEGLGRASADYVLLLSADDFLLPGALARATRLMDEHRDVGFVFGNAIALNDSGEKRTITTPLLEGWKLPARRMTGDEFIRLSGAANIVPTPTAVVRTSLQHRVGGYRKDLPHTGDMEMWLRLAAHANIAVVNAHQAVYRRHSHNMSHDYQWLKDLKQRESALRSFLDECSPRLQDAGQTATHLFECLGSEAIGAASSAFNAESADLMYELMTYALSVNPSARYTLPWAKLSVKRHIGLKTWRMAAAIWPRRGTKRSSFSN